ncbi:PAS domain S-box protein [Bacillus lacus]|uniref:histidine kinase n=1 Tax=Metabacillus lacus TaxID=1983721 RepID=A0A7X2IZ32_9BACI|nr:PAS domain S-box protein [Metabacillus lacus]MRX72453.1 PAS domain S-box protein [Metabacillus lacus]
MFQSTIFKEIFYQSSLPQLVSTTDFSEVACNPAFYEFIGYEEKDLTLQTLSEMLPVESREQDIMVLKTIASGHKKEFQGEKRFVTRNTVIKIGILKVSLIQDCTSGKDYLLAQVIDITEKVQSERKYRLLAEHSTDMINLHDVDSTYLYVCPSVQTILGFLPEEMIYKRPLEYILEEDHHLLREAVSRMSPDNPAVVVQFRAVRRDGSLVWMETAIKGMFDDATNELRELISVSRDIQQRVETNQLIRKSEKLAVVGQLAAAVAHEIRNPLTPIKGFMQLFSSTKEYNPLYTEIVLQELERVESIISEFLSMSKPHIEKKEYLAADDLARQVVQLLKAQAALQNQDISLKVKGHIPEILGDSNSLKQVLLNVIQNALDAIRERGFVEVTISALSSGSISIKVADNGCGIPKDRLSQLGEPFYSTKEKGTGLGLMTCFKILEDHHGRMTIESEEGTGTTVTILLPGDEKAKAYS